MLLQTNANEVTKDTLFCSMAWGKAITLFDRSVNMHFTGRICGIELESGFTPPAEPCHFNVTLHVERCSIGPWIGTKRTIYVRTERA